MKSLKGDWIFLYNVVRDSDCVYGDREIDCVLLVSRRSACIDDMRSADSIFCIFADRFDFCVDFIDGFGR